MTIDQGEVTVLLHAMRMGNQAAGEKLLPLVYSELHRLARSYMRKERVNHTLQPTALINEAYMRLAQASVDWQNRAHFVGVAANVMRRILVDHARTHAAAAHGGKLMQIELSDALGMQPERSIELLAVDEALDRLEKVNARQAKTVELHYIGGLTFEEIAEVLAISSRSAKRDWALARLWLFQHLSKGRTPAT